MWEQCFWRLEKFIMAERLLMTSNSMCLMLLWTKEQRIFLLCFFFFLHGIQSENSCKIDCRLSPVSSQTVNFPSTFTGCTTLQLPHIMYISSSHKMKTYRKSEYIFHFIWIEQLRIYELYCVYIYPLVIHKDLWECWNVSAGFPCVLLVYCAFQSETSSIFFSLSSSLFIPMFAINLTNYTYNGFKDTFHIES